MDESSIRDYQALQKAWCRKGIQKSIPTYGKHQTIKLIGALDYESGEVLCLEKDKFTAKEFQEFLEYLLRKNPGEKIVIILDNSRNHHAACLKEFLDENKNLELMFLPPYSPDLNMIEELWAWLQSTVVNNVFYETKIGLKKGVRRFWKYLNDNMERTREKLCMQY